MPQKKNDITYTAADIEKYHKGLLAPGERHALEKAALEDPFLAEALEGYAVHHRDITGDIADLRTRLSERTREEKEIAPVAGKSTRSFTWWKVAAMLVLIAGAGAIAYFTVLNRQTNEIAQSPRQDTTNYKTEDTTRPVTKMPAEPLASAPLTKKTTDAKTNKNEERSPGESLREPGNRTLFKKENEPPVSSARVPENTAAELEKDKKMETALAAQASRQRNEIEKKNQQEAYKQPENTPGDPQQKNALAGRAPGINAKTQNNFSNNRSNIFRGRVTDAQNNALPFSNITNTQDNIGTYADANGFFNLTSPDSILNVTVSSIGFEPSHVQLQNNITGNQVSLQEDRSLSEVVISRSKANSSRTRSNTLVLEEPEPADGWVNYDIYLANNLKEPEVLKEKEPGTRGEVELSFEVNKLGEPVNITVKKSLCEACDKEAIRLVREGPKWKRKARKGKVTVKIPF